MKWLSGSRGEGEEIALLALLDTMNFSQIPPLSIWSRSYYSCERLGFHAANFLRLDFKGKFSFFREKIQVLRNRLPVWWGMILGKFEKKTGAAELRISRSRKYLASE